MATICYLWIPMSKLKSQFHASINSIILDKALRTRDTLDSLTIHQHRHTNQIFVKKFLMSLKLEIKWESKKLSSLSS